jgi:hypothetical protein
MFNYFKKYRRLSRLLQIKAERINQQLNLANDALSIALLIEGDQRAIKESIFNALHYLENCSEINKNYLVGAK